MPKQKPQNQRADNCKSTENPNRVVAILKRYSVEELFNPDYEEEDQQTVCLAIDVEKLERMVNTQSDIEIMVNPLELASELAERELLGKWWQLTGKHWDANPEEGGVYDTSEDKDKGYHEGDIRYTEKAQGQFNDLYQEYLELLMKTKTN